MVSRKDEAPKPTERGPRVASTNWKLLERAGRGEDSAFRDLVDRHHARALSFATGILGDPRLAEDILQRAFVNIHRKARALAPRARFQTFLFKVVRNLCLKELERTRLPATFTDLAGDEDGDVLRLIDRGEDEGDPAAALEHVELQAILREAFGRLPPSHREALWLAEAGHAYAEIAEIMEATLPAVKTWIHRARRELERLIGPYLERGSWPA